MPNIDLEGIRFAHYDPIDLPEELWEPLQQVRTDAWTEVFTDRTPEEMSTFLGSVVSFREASIDPNVLVGKKFNDNQEYRWMDILVAFDGDEPVGYVKTADNVSGETQEIREAKWNTTIRRYRTGVELVVHPDAQHRGIALTLSYGGLMTALWGQVATVYEHPRENPVAERNVRRMGGKIMGTSPRHDFGEDADPVVLAGYKLAPGVPERLPAKLWLTPARAVGYGLLLRYPELRKALRPHKYDLRRPSRRIEVPEK